MAREKKVRKYKNKDNSKSIVTSLIILVCNVGCSQIGYGKEHSEVMCTINIAMFTRIDVEAGKKGNGTRSVSLYNPWIRYLEAK